MSLRNYSNASVRAALLLTWLPVALFAVRPESQLEVRLLTHLTSYSSLPGTPFECVVLRTLHPYGRVAIPKGSLIFGTVRKQQGVGLGFRHERAALELNFERYRTPDGEVFPLAARLSSIDNAREEVTPKGRIKGVLAANNPGNLLNGFWARPSTNIVFRSLIGLTGAANQVWARYSMGPIGAAGLMVARCVIVTFPEPEIHLPPGTDFKLTADLPAESPSDQPENGPTLTRVSSEATAAAIRRMEETDDLTRWLEERLGPITYANGQPAADLFNVLLFGSRREVVSAFQVAGWIEADARTLAASSRVYTAFSAMRSYAAAPVSPLLYHGAQPDLVFEKSFNTIAQRHHVRFWKVDDFAGQEVWIGAATHDTGVKFRLASMSFTHKIDADLDQEREKVSTDLSFAGCSGDAYFLDAPRRPLPAANQGTTDGRVAVLAARPCEPSIVAGDAPRRPGNPASRFTRRIVLETRNYLLRDNAYYWGYRLIRSAHGPGHSLLH